MHENCFKNKAIFGHKGVKIGESVYSYMRIKWHFFKKDRRKAHQKRPTILIFGKRWSILFKARKMNKLSLLLFESLKEMERRGGGQE